MAKLTKKAADYEKASKRGVNCGTCAYMHNDGTCAKVAGIVTKPMVCRLWRKAK
jgi:hypothetical protein